MFTHIYSYSNVNVSYFVPKKVDGTEKFYWKKVSSISSAMSGLTTDVDKVKSSLAELNTALNDLGTAAQSSDFSGQLIDIGQDIDTACTAIQQITESLFGDIESKLDVMAAKSNDGGRSVDSNRQSIESTIERLKRKK